MRRSWTALTFLCIAFPLSPIQGQNAAAGDDNVSSMNMSQSSGAEHDNPAEASAGDAAMRSMQSHHMGMGPHMKMTALRPLRPGDKEKATEVAQAARQAAEKYSDYRVALAEGYRVFLPNIPQRQYHFTNYRNAYLARNHFDPSSPTSLLYEKSGDGYRLVGVMYTARKDASEDELNARIPLSIAQWHAHVNLCVPPRSQPEEVFQPGHKFGLNGSIATKGECEAAGGRFFPQVFGWMVHVYPFETNAEGIWSVERQRHMD